MSQIKMKQSFIHVFFFVATYVPDFNGNKIKSNISYWCNSRAVFRCLDGYDDSCVITLFVCSQRLNVFICLETGNILVAFLLSIPVSCFNLNIYHSQLDNSVFICFDIFVLRFNTFDKKLRVRSSLAAYRTTNSWRQPNNLRHIYRCSQILNANAIGFMGPCFAINYSLHVWTPVLCIFNLKILAY